MMRLIRIIVGKSILFLDAVIPVKKACVRSAEESVRIQKELDTMVIYQFEACPFCIKVRRGLRRLDLKIHYLDAKNDPDHKRDLTELGGKHKVPCLRIRKDGKDEWLYESKDILKYFEQLFPCATPA